jgi:phosphatidylglycerol:prolipoprotein diacylglycerol transferase
VRPTPVTVRNVSLPTHPALLYLGLVAGIVAQNAVANAAGLPSGRVYVATFGLLPIALAGARLLHVATHWSEYRDDPRQIIDRTTGGMALYGGLLVMLPASLPVLALLAIPFWPFWDVALFPILVTMICARLGCLLNGCCVGRPTTGHLGTWLCDAHGEWARRIPTQLLEATLAAALLIVAITFRLVLPRPGQLFLLAAGLFGAGRLVLLPLRADRSRDGVMRLISVSMIVGGIGGLLLLET